MKLFHLSSVQGLKTLAPLKPTKKDRPRGVYLSFYDHSMSGWYQYFKYNLRCHTIYQYEVILEKDCQILFGRDNFGSKEYLRQKAGDIIINDLPRFHEVVVKHTIIPVSYSLIL
jgi:hypothetical protein